MIALQKLWKHLKSSFRTQESGICGKEGKELQKFEYLENEKSFFGEIKKIFIVFKGLSFGKKIKKW